MSLEIIAVLAVLGAAIVLFVSEKVRVDVVALLVLVSLALSGLVEPQQALSGFSNPAVITVWAVFILSGGLARTGVASWVGRQVLRLAGQGEAGLIVTIMLTAGFLSAFMNNVAVAALLLPVVMDIARRTDRPPAKLLIPLAFSSLLGGLTTLIGTPPNLLISEALRESGREPFRLFDFTPVGLAVMLAGVAFMSLVGRHLLPRGVSDPKFSADGEEELRQLYNLRERLFVVRLPQQSPLVGRSLAESRLGAALGLNVIGILGAGGTRLAPPPETTLRPGDRLLVGGDLEELSQLRGQEYLDLETESLDVKRLISAEIQLVHVELLPGSELVGQTLGQTNFRRRFGAIVLAVKRAGSTRRTNLERLRLKAGDLLLVQGTSEQFDQLRQDECLLVSGAPKREVADLEKRLMVCRVPEGSFLAGKTLTESRLGHAFGLGVMGIVRGDQTRLMPDPDETLLPGDSLLIKGKREDLLTAEGLHDLEVDSAPLPDLRELESERVGLAEVVLSPRSTLAGKSLASLHFREKYGLNVIAISREGKTLRRNLRDLPLRFGDALLLYGSRDKLRVLGSEPDFLVLTEDAQQPLRLQKAPLAALLMGGVVLSVIVGWLPIYIAAVAGAVLMVLTGCLTMDEAYRAIEWRAVFLIAGMLPLGLAMQETGAAHLMTEKVVGTVGDWGPLAVVAALFLVTAVGAQVMPTAAVAILIAPIALSTAQDLGLSPRALMMTVSLSASASFLSPVAHPANVLIMGPGGYRFLDYIRVGLPLTLVCLAVVLLVLPLVWPLLP